MVADMESKHRPMASMTLLESRAPVPGGQVLLLIVLTPQAESTTHPAGWFDELEGEPGWEDAECL